MAVSKTGGYDIVLEMGERFPNKLIAAYYAMGKFPRLTGSYTLPIANIPADLLDFVTITYDVQFGIPALDFVSPHKIKICLSSESNFTILGGLPFKLDVFFSVVTSFIYDEPAKQLLVDFTDPHIDIEINDQRMSQNVLNRFNEILSIVFREYLQKEVPKIDLAPFVQYNLSFPGVKQDFPIAFRSCKITNKMLAMAINCLNYDAGKRSLVKDFTAGDDLAVAISENAMGRILDFWWNHGPIKKQFQDSRVISHFSLQHSIKNFDTFLDLFVPLSFLSSFLFRFEGLSVSLNYTIDLEKPDLNLRHNNKLALHGKAKGRFSLRFNMHYKRRRWKKYKFVWKHYTKTLASWTDDVKISYLGQAQVLLDHNGNLSADLNYVRLLIDVDDFPKIFDAVFTIVANIAADKLLKNYPPIELGSMPVSHQIPGTRLKLSFSPTLSTTGNEAIIRTPVEISGFFIANSNPNCMEVHQADCEWVKLILEHHKKVYYWLKDAHKDGYDNCHFCLGGSTR
jgi:hypothetical protein